MSTAFTHAFVALAAGAACFPRPMPRKLWLLAPLCSVLPDLDVGLHAYGVEYGDPWGHRGMTHSIAFALVLALVVVTWLFRREAPLGSRRWLGLTAFFFLVTASHGFIDAFTDGGLGIAFFAPFDHTRFFMPWNPLPVPHFGLANLFTAYGGRVLMGEVIWVWLPASLVVGLVLARRTWALRS